MTQAQWNKHADHMADHIAWPATKKDIVDACNGEDVEPGVMAEVKMLPDRTYKNAAQLKKLLVKS